ncbi:hypothetical protein IJ670_03465 [bacterium]|nr:hypothetical protein [bacterium]
MKINSINNLNFQKKQVGKCQIKSAQNREKKDCTISKFNPKNPDDFLELETSDQFWTIRSDFNRAQNQKHCSSDFYFIQDNNSKDFVSAVEISKHLSDKGEKYIAIEEIEVNDDYIDSITPILGYVSYLAEKFGAANIQTSFGIDDFALAQNRLFAKNNGHYTISPSSYNEILYRAQSRENLDTM